MKDVFEFLAGVVAVLFFHVVILIVIGISVDLLMPYFPDSWKQGHLPGLNFLAIALLGLGLWQLIYVIPLSLYLKKMQKPRIVQGVLLTAGLTVLTTAICGALVF